MRRASYSAIRKARSKTLGSAPFSHCPDPFLKKSLRDLGGVISPSGNASPQGRKASWQEVEAAEGRRRRVVKPSGGADSQGWVKLGQETLSRCPKMASPFLHRPQDMAQCWEDCIWNPSHSEKRKGRELLRQLGCLRTATRSPLAHVRPESHRRACLQMGGPTKHRWSPLQGQLHISKPK